MGCTCGWSVGLGIVDGRGGGVDEVHDRLLSDMCDAKYPVSGIRIGQSLSEPTGGMHDRRIQRPKLINQTN